MALQHTSDSTLTELRSGCRKSERTPPVRFTGFALRAAPFRPLPAPGFCPSLSSPAAAQQT